MDDRLIDLKKLGSTIRFLRHGKGWALGDLADKSGVSKAYISDLENGAAGKPNIQYVFNVAVALDATLDQLLKDATAKDQRTRKRKSAEDLPPGLSDLQQELELGSQFGTSFEATTFRLATAHPDFAVAGLLQYRYTLGEERRLHKNSKQRLLFSSPSLPSVEPAEKKYRRQSLHMSANCGDEHLIRWNKSFERTSVVYKAREGGVHRAVESLPNQSGLYGQLEAVLSPFQREEADGRFGDVLFFWQLITQ